MKAEKYEELINRIIAVIEDLHTIEQIILNHGEFGDITIDLYQEVKICLNKLFTSYTKLIEFY